MADGKVSLPYGQFLGYEKGKDGLPKIVESEAEVVRMIYRWFMEGMTPSAIASELMKQGIPSPPGKGTWYPSTVKSILSNEKYKGDALLQKKFTEDFLTKKLRVNQGQVPQFYVENSLHTSSSRTSLTRYRPNWSGGADLDGLQDAEARSLRRSSAEIVLAGMDRKCGRALPNTGRPSGNATISTKVSTSAGRGM